MHKVPENIGLGQLTVRLEALGFRFNLGPSPEALLRKALQLHDEALRKKTTILASVCIAMKDRIEVMS